MRQRVLLVAAAMELRARFGRELQSSGYAVELASDEKRALKLAQDDNYQVAILAPGPSSASLELMRELRDTVPKMIVLAEGSVDIERLRRSLPTVDEFLLTSASEGALTARVGELIGRTDSTACESRPAPGTLCIEDCRLDLTGCVFVDAAGREVTLTRAETNFLKELAASPCQVVSRDKLRRAVAGRDADPFDRSVDMLVASGCGAKSKPDPKVPWRFLVTVPGIGYKLVARPQCADVGQPGLKPNEPERRQVTALACKLVGAMGFAVNLDPEDLVEITQNFQDAAAEAITEWAERLLTPWRLTKSWLSLDIRGRMRTMAPNARVNAGLRCGDTKSARTRISKGRACMQARAAIATGLAFASRPRQTLGQSSVIAQGICDYGGAQLRPRHCEYAQFLSAAVVCENPERYAALPGLFRPRQQPAA